MKTFLYGAIVALTAYSCFDKPPLSNKPKDPSNAKLKKSALKNLDASIKTGTPVEEPTADGITIRSPTAKIETQAETGEQTGTIPTTSINNNIDNHSKQSDQPKTNTEKKDRQTPFTLDDNKVNNGQPVQDKNTPTTPKLVAIVQPISIPIVNHSEVDYKKTNQPRTNTEKTVQQNTTPDYTFKTKERTLKEKIQTRKNIIEAKEKELNLEKKIFKLKKRRKITRINKEEEEEEEEIKKLQKQLNDIRNKLKGLQLFYTKIKRFSIQDIMKYNEAVSNLHYNKYDRTKTKTIAISYRQST